MPREDVEFKTADDVTLRGWLYTPESSSDRLPCLVMAHGFSALKEMDLNTFAEYFTSNLPIACLVYDNRGLGDSDTKEGHPRQEIIPALQISDYSDAITYAQTLPQVDPDKIGVWGSSYSGGHVLWVGAVDRRVKVVLSQAPLVDGWENFHRLVRADHVSDLDKLFQDDRLARASGKPAITMPVVAAETFSPAGLPGAGSFEFFSAWQRKCTWKNEVTVKSIEAMRGYLPASHIQHIAPTPLLMTVASNDVLTPTDLALQAYARALEPKRLNLLPGGHFDAYSGPFFEKNASVQAEFLKTYLCSL